MNIHTLDSGKTTLGRDEIDFFFFFVGFAGFAGFFGGPFFMIAAVVCVRVCVWGGRDATKGVI
jgi:hypothetical protein